MDQILPQAVDGTKVAANAAGDQTCDMARLEKLLARTEDAISELEAQNISGDGPSPPARQWSSNRPKSCGSASSMPCPAWQCIQPFHLKR